MLDRRREEDSVQVSVEAPLAEDKSDGEINPIDGHNNVLVIAPHGFSGDDDHTDIIAKELADNFGFYAVINTKYQKEIH